ncbi:lactonase family protein [Flavobacterium sp.]|uniref:lactonase family protein n=1 Tax=Flavobacterium sp. TaxID=239 RepID=UPI0026095283|nr:lactonase family protein [Flavobacterium sp.]
MKIHSVFCIFTLCFMASCSNTKTTNYLVGTYTNDVSHGINLVNFNQESKSLTTEKVISGVENPSFVVANKSKTIIVTVEEIALAKGGKVTSFSYDEKTKSITKLNSIFTNGDHPCTVAFSPNENFVLVGNYSGGSLSVFPIDKNGMLSESSNFIQYEGQSVNKERQEKPHVHCIVVHPKENIIAVADLGRDAIELIPFDENSKSFLINEKAITTNVKMGSGPRHLVWNKAGNRLYVTYELTNEVAAFEYNKGKLTELQTIALTKEKTNGSTAELRLCKDEKFIYASVRGVDNHIVVMKIMNDKIEKVQTIATERTPRNFILSENQKSVLVASQGSNLISVFDRNEKTGWLTKTSITVSINQPVYLFPF